MPDHYRYASTVPVEFVVSLSGIGQPGLAFAANDIRLTIDNGTPIDIIGEVTEMTIGDGCYMWTPLNATRTTGKTLLISIKDADSGGLFNQNKILIKTGGHANAYFNAL